jgi:molecular chaperone GrpE
MNDWRNITGGGAAMSLGECQTALETARKENAELKDSFLRMAAALDNTRKNGERDVQMRVNEKIRRVALSLLEVADNLERALAYAPPEDVLRPGVQATLRQLQTALEREGVQPIHVQPGAPFDPHMHEAVAGHPADVERETVQEVVQSGYVFADQVLRPARVIVAMPRER